MKVEKRERCKGWEWGAGKRGRRGRNSDLLERFKLEGLRESLVDDKGFRLGRRLICMWFIIINIYIDYCFAWEYWSLNSEGLLFTWFNRVCFVLIKYDGNHYGFWRLKLVIEIQRVILYLSYIYIYLEMLEYCQKLQLQLINIARKCVLLTEQERKHPL